MHGGNIYDNRVRLDFSVSINPLGIPEEVERALSASLCHADCYPDPENRALRDALAERFHLTPGKILVGNGASELIPAIVRAVQPKSALLVSPCFSGYERALAAAGITPCLFPLKEEQGFVPGGDFLVALEREKPGIVFLANPANPSGALTKRRFLLAAADLLAAWDGVLVCDECFLALSGRKEESVLAKPEEFLKRANLVMLNAFTKTFAIPGIRIGFAAFSSEELAEKTALQLPEWNLSVPAEEAGLACLSIPDSYLKDSVTLIRRERAALAKALTDLGASAYPSEGNFLLFRWNRDQDLYQILLDQGILIRDCRDYRGLSKGYYRIAVRRKEENAELIRCLAGIAGKGIPGA